MTCQPPLTLSPPMQCAEHTNMGALCQAVTTILVDASCEELHSQPFVQRLIEKVGLVGDLRRERIYGAAAKHMRRMGSHSGLWQDPQQISRALIVLGEVRRRDPTVPFRYVEVGVYTAWTCCLVSAYLRRVAGASGFAGLAVDVKISNIAQGTFDIFSRLNVTFEGRSAFDRRMRDGTAPFFDACFIDGNHGYSAVRGDYAQMAPMCGATMFHDIQDSSTMMHDGYSGGGACPRALCLCATFMSHPPAHGQDTARLLPDAVLIMACRSVCAAVPMFWAHARSHVRPKRVVELTMQYAPYWPVFGIGVLLPGPTGTAEPDDGVAVAQWPAWQGSGPAKLWRTLCADHPSLTTAAPGGRAPRLPPQYAAHAVLCPVANETNLDASLGATKRTVPRPLLDFATRLPWPRPPAGSPS
jgi:hypothetical protein